MNRDYWSEVLTLDASVVLSRGLMGVQADMQAEQCYAIMRIWGYAKHFEGVSIIWRRRDGSLQQTPYFEHEPAASRRTYLESVATAGGHSWPEEQTYIQASSG